MNINEKKSKTNLKQSENLRQRGKKITEIVQQLDSFPKLSTEYHVYTVLGAITTIFMSFCVVWLIGSEIVYYYESSIYNTFVPDVEFKDKLIFNVDMTVAMPCQEIGADIIDLTNQDENEFGSFNKADTWFELSEEQQSHFQHVQRINSYFRDKYHSLRNVIWNSRYYTAGFTMPSRKEMPKRPYDACHIFGHLELNKVTGNFHITAGQSISVAGGHIHLPQLFYTQSNFSHRIDNFSFGALTPGIVHPLDGNMRITKKSSQVYKYYIEVVPTEIESYGIKTYQYSVKEVERVHDDFGAQGISGIFFKYDVNPFKVIIKENKGRTIFQLFLRICGGLGGLYIILGLFKNVLETIENIAFPSKLATAAH